MNVELTRFKVKEGKTQLVSEWLSFLNENMKDVLITLEDEKMYVESIFREEVDGREYLYWFSIQDEGGKDIEESNHWIDKKHMEYWDECIDSSYRPVELSPEVIMIPDKVRESMK